MARVSVRRGPRRPYNEAMRLYEMNVDEVFQATHHVVTDSSLGLVPDEPRDGKRRPRAGSV
jgi:hypothetical protein